MPQKVITQITQIPILLELRRNSGHYEMGNLLMRAGPRPGRRCFKFRIGRRRVTVKPAASSGPAPCRLTARWHSPSSCHGSSRCGLAALQRGHRHRLHRRYCCLFFGRSGVYYDPGGRASAAALGPRVPRPRMLATQRARSEIFKLSLLRDAGSGSPGTLHYDRDS